MEDWHQTVCFARSQIFEINVRNHLSGKVAFALYAEDLVLQLHQPAAFEAQLPKPPCTMQDIKVSHPTKWRLLSRHAIAGFEERLVVRLAVIRDQNIKLRKVLGKR